MQKKIIALGLLIGAMVGSEAIAGYDNTEKGGRAGRRRTRRRQHQLALATMSADKRSNVARNRKDEIFSRKFVDDEVSSRMKRLKKEHKNGKPKRPSKLFRVLDF